MAYTTLSEHADVRFPEGLADVRGYEVRSQLDGEKVGKVNDLVCEADGSIRYLDVDAGGFFNPRHVLLPIGAAHVDARDEVVWLSSMTKEQVKALPDFTGDVRDLGDDYDTRTRGLYGSGVVDTDLYDQGRFYADRGPADARERRLVLSEERLDIQKRQVQAGEVSVRKHVETEHVRETVPVTHEEVTIERRPISADDARATDSRDTDFRDDEIRVPVMKEEVVASKRVVPTEEVVVRTEPVTEERVVEEDVRRERADVDDEQRVVRADRAVDRDVMRDDRTIDRTTDRTLADRTDYEGRTDVDDRAADAARRTGRRASNAVDDLKDRVDGNPASRPGPDATDREERL